MNFQNTPKIEFLADHETGQIGFKSLVTGEDISLYGFDAYGNPSSAGATPLRKNQLVGSARGGGNNLPATTISVSSGTAVGYSYGISAWAPFYQVRLVFANHTNVPAVMNDSCVAAASTAYPGGVFNIAQPSSAWSSPTGPLTIPASLGTTLAERLRIPGLLLGPVIPVRSVPRASGELDGGKYELLLVRQQQAAGNLTFTYGDLGNGFPAAYDPNNEGFSLLVGSPVFAANFCTSPNSYNTSTRADLPAVAIVGAIFSYDYKVTTVGGPGDSVYAGLGAANGKLGFPYLFKAMARIRASGKKVGYYNSAISGSAMPLINTHGRDLVDLNIIDIMPLHSYTINSDVSTQAAWDAQWSLVMDLAQYHIDKRSSNQVVLCTPLPDNSFNATRNGYRLIQRQRVINSGYPYIDFESFANATGGWANAAYQGDGTHPSPAGYEALAAYAKPVINALIP